MTRGLVLVPVTAAWALLPPGRVVFELSAVALAVLITLELAEAKGWEIPSSARWPRPAGRPEPVRSSPEAPGTEES